ncbi:hypothetical protein Herbaro_09395 [Herbaspirillum sp. WKF16]|uniref:hypothetical protein n=1 Tax=Herbaspirillum sp. WKF16 TaxID=3028312 RepID=UPI0023A9C79C|nr:hypothetical protein [Herbaspirillum sp. WKF16]WDZ97974.1 hypothetical protein Herbaro_09395 [Herbaspirillum sp. WKF16]
MPDISTGYSPGPGGYYRLSDRSGPYTIDAAGNATLMTSTGQNPLPAGTSRSGSIAAGGTAQTLAAANAARLSLKGQNISSADLWINEIGANAAPDTAGSYRVAAGATFSISTNRAISIYGATTGQAFSATET